MGHGDAAAGVLTDGVVVLREPRDDDAPALVALGDDPEILRWTEVPEGVLPAHRGAGEDRLMYAVVR